MARIARVAVAGVPHHIMQRGNRWQVTFFQDGDYALYLSLLGEASFLEHIERSLGRMVRPHRRGSKPKETPS